MLLSISGVVPVSSGRASPKMFMKRSSRPSRFEEYSLLQGFLIRCST